MGDLGGKYGTLVGLDNVTSTYADQNLPLFGPQSILGRSIVIHRYKFNIFTVSCFPKIYFAFLYLINSIRAFVSITTYKNKSLLMKIVAKDPV